MRPVESILRSDCTLRSEASRAFGLVRIKHALNFCAILCF
jgi:hypothetical protein